MAQESATHRYSLEHTLPSCLISVELIRELERYLRAVPNEDPLEIEITDRFGTHTLSTISDYSHRYWPSGTKSIEISQLHRFMNGATISFEKGRATLRVVFHGKDAREQALRTKDGLLVLLEPYENSNYIVHTGWFVAASALVSGCGWFLLALYPESRKDAATWVLPAALILPNFAAFVKPYSLFDTKDNAKRQKWVNWVFLAMCSALIGVIVRAIVKIA